METEPLRVALEGVVLGRVVGAHGLRGQVRVRYFGDGPDNLLSMEDVWLAESPEGAAAETWAVRARGTGRGGEVRLTLVPDVPVDLESTRLLLPADSEVDLSGVDGAVILRAQGQLTVEGTLQRSIPGIRGARTSSRHSN